MNIRVLIGLAFAAATCVAVLLVAGAAPAGAKHRVVFQVTAENDPQWDALLHNVENLRTALGPENTEVEVVAHGTGLGLVLATDQAQAERMRKLADAGVSFAACENTMRRKHVTREQLLPFVKTVDSGVAEVVRKQEAGWAYLKSGQ